jgi:hypothetical protein
MCNEVELVFRELPDVSQDNSGAEISCIETVVLLDLDDFQEIDRPDRAPVQQAIVDEFLSKSDERRKQLFRDRYRATKRETHQKRAYRLNREEVAAGQLVEFARVVAGPDVELTANDRVTYDFELEGRRIVVADMYCSRPECDCQRIHLLFSEIYPREQVGEGESRLVRRRLFMGAVSLEGARQVMESYAMTTAQASQLLEYWWQDYAHDLGILTDRYHAVKEAGQRALRAAEVAVADSFGAGIFSAEDDQQGDGADEDIDFDGLAFPPSSRARGRVGRNDPCPCGSGKKFKKCCGATWRDA